MATKPHQLSAPQIPVPLWQPTDKASMEPGIRFSSIHGIQLQPTEMLARNLMPPFNSADKSTSSSGSAGPDSFARADAATGSLYVSASNLMIDPSGNCTAESYAWVNAVRNVGPDDIYGSRMQLYTNYHINRSGASLRILDRNGPSTLGLSMSQWLSQYLYKEHGGQWVNIPEFNVQTRAFLETRDYGVGQGGDDQRTWDRSNFNWGVQLFDYKPTPIVAGDTILIVAQLFTQLHFNATYFTTSNRTDLDARVTSVNMYFAP